jgi:hypothetical protein
VTDSIVREITIQAGLATVCTDGGVRVRVVESGFEAQIAQGVRDNSGGWAEELAKLGREAEAATV